VEIYIQKPAIAAVVPQAAASSGRIRVQFIGYFVRHTNRISLRARDITIEPLSDVSWRLPVYFQLAEVHNRYVPDSTMLNAGWMNEVQYHNVGGDQCSSKV
jgi:hypothetical protein